MARLLFYDIRTLKEVIELNKSIYYYEEVFLSNNAIYNKVTLEEISLCGNLDRLYF